MSIPNATATPPGERSMAPIRWPRMTAAGIALFLLWVVGVVVGVLVPAAIVPPSALSAPGRDLAAAIGFTVLGVVIMSVAGFMGYRRQRETGVLVSAITPSIALLLGGLAMLGSKAFEVVPVTP